MAKRDPNVIKFTAELEKMPGRFAWTYVEFPHDVEKLFGKRGVVRVKGMINGVPIDRALMPRKSGYHMIVLSAQLRKKAKVEVGERAAFEIWLNDRPDELELSEELKETLDFFPEFALAWKKLRPGMKRSMCIWINSGKTVATRAKRVAELLRRFDSGHPWFGGRQVKG
jgi:hypothetical protein